MTSPTTQSQPVTFPFAQDENSAIAQSLAARRRRSLASVLRDFRIGRSAHKTIDDRVVQEESEEEDDDEYEDPERVNTLDLEAYKRAMGDTIKMEQSGEIIDPDSIETEAAGLEFVWDVLFENQRGIYLLGTAYYSSNTLLPKDPSPFTRPDRTAPITSSFAVADPSQNPTVQPVKSSKKYLRKVQAKSTIPTQSNRTSYTLETYQPPSPEWEYLTPWMVNMRTGTDELGWRYNAWFRKKGWNSHAGNLGWWGWVRRREWVRLRARKPRRKEEDKPSEKRYRTSSYKLEDVLSGDVSDNVLRVLKVMGELGVDRERLELWKNWLDGIQKGGQVWNRLQELVTDREAVSTLLYYLSS
ncbi:hypothetical protein LQV05_000291 [Cryptococcus neoformans]|nr:hypothetical protein J007_00322 [Cryptococcus neoformans var. grubii]OXC66180.1 hypothetical protein C358_00318 [Cryptococcus neoformans var. grubii MW-RSA852]UOH79296.1 hypothetical protein LQV05_000291 [Cryptococcus neoformans]